MYKHYPITGKVQLLTEVQAHKLMDKISPQWEDESTKAGVLFMGVYDWDFTDSENELKLNIPHLRTGGQIPLNELASKQFDFEIYGDCFLKI